VPERAARPRTERQPEAISGTRCVTTSDMAPYSSTTDRSIAARPNVDESAASMRSFD
jgi:hypothetical protein